MSETAPDRTLLREFAKTGSEEAFAHLLKRHIDLVFGTAMRRVNDSAAAQEIAQNVFLRLARKAFWLPCEHSLAAWLHETTIREARQWWRTELRRHRRERAAVELHTTMKDDPSTLQELVPVLDEALLKLREKDRQAIMLRFLEGRSQREVGSILGIGEDAARKRIDKALDEITLFFQRRGYALSGAGSATALLRTSVQAAPTGLAASALKGALSAKIGGPVAMIGLLLNQLLSLSRLGGTAACLAISAGPVVWETYSLIAARSDQALLKQRLEDERAHVALLKQDQAQLERRLTLIGRTFEDIRADLRHRLALAKSLPVGDDPNFYRWSEQSEYIRLPKSLLNRVRLYDEAMNPWPNQESMGRYSEILNRRGRVSEVLLQALGLDESTRAVVKAAFLEFAEKYRQLEAQNATLTDIPGSPGRSGGPTLTIAAFSSDCQPLKQKLRDTLNDTMGRERADLLWSQCQATFHFVFGSFGERERTRNLQLAPDGETPMVEECEEGHMTHAVPPDELPEQFAPYITAWRHAPKPQPNHP